GRRGPRRRLPDGAGERPPRELRSKEMHASAQRTGGDGPALPRRLDLLSGAAAAAPGRDDAGERRGELLHLGRSVWGTRLGHEPADWHRQWIGRAARLEGREMDRVAGPLSHGVLYEVDGWPDRRCESRLDRAGAVGDGEHARAISHGGREGHHEQGPALSAAARSARATRT